MNLDETSSKGIHNILHHWSNCSKLCNSYLMFLWPFMPKIWRCHLRGLWCMWTTHGYFLWRDLLLEFLVCFPEHVQIPIFNLKYSLLWRTKVGIGDNPTWDLSIDQRISLAGHSLMGLSMGCWCRIGSNLQTLHWSQVFGGLGGQKCVEPCWMHYPCQS